MNESIERIIKEWPKNPRESAERLIEYYGEPEDVLGISINLARNERWVEAKRTV